MKYVLSLALYFIFLINTPAQEKLDYTWVMGYFPNDSIQGYGGTLINFNNPEPLVSYIPIPFDVGASAQICDKTGDLLFYSNGCKIANYQHQLISNGDGINPGVLHNEWCNTGDNLSYSTYQGMIALPWPEREGQYVMFHLGWFRTDTWPPRTSLRDFYFTRIDMTANDGLGAVLEKNNLLLQDTNLVDNLTAVRHGNGRDWWIVEPSGKSDFIYLYLLTPYGIKGPFIERTGLSMSTRGFNAGQVVFSPDGTKYVRVNAADGVDIFCFDRCRGEFICGERLPFPGGETDGISGAAISPSSRYLYISALTKMFQYDLWSKDVDASKVLLGVYDGFGDPHSTVFFQQMLTPGGKIYITVPNSTRYLHVIHQPDSAGIQCDFRQHDLKMPTKHGFCVPNFPHFRLYDLPGSPCDSLGIDAPEGYRVLWSPTDAIRLFPNPNVDGQVTVTLPPCAGGRLRIFNTAGALLAAYTIDHDRLFRIDCSGFPNGVYIVSFAPADGHRPLSAKLVLGR